MLLFAKGVDALSHVKRIFFFIKNWVRCNFFLSGIFIDLVKMHVKGWFSFV